jgi:hypothetical protein
MMLRGDDEHRVNAFCLFFRGRVLASLCVWLGWAAVVEVGRAGRERGDG